MFDYNVLRNLKDKSNKIRKTRKIKGKPTEMQEKLRKAYDLTTRDIVGKESVYLLRFMMMFPGNIP